MSPIGAQARAVGRQRAVQAITTVDGFEDYSTGSMPPSPWQSNGSDPTVRNNATQWGSNTVRMDNDPGSNVHVLYTTGQAGTPDKLQFAYNEDGSGMTGILMYVLDDGNNMLFSMGTNNPEVEVNDDSGENILKSNFSSSYGEWRRCTAVFDWASNQFDFTWEDITGGASDVTYTGDIITGHNGNVAEVGLKSQSGGQGNLGVDVDEVSRFKA